MWRLDAQTADELQRNNPVYSYMPSEYFGDMMKSGRYFQPAKTKGKSKSKQDNKVFTPGKNRKQKTRFF